MLAFCCWALVQATPAAAHAGLLRSEPAPGATLDEPPADVALLFGAAVELTPDAVQVFGPDAQRVDDGEAELTDRNTVVRQPIHVEQPGTYAVAFRITSADGHTVTGSFTYDYQRASGGGAAKLGARAAATDAGLQWGFGIARAFEVLALLVAVGGGVFATVVLPGWYPRWVIAGLLVVLVAGGVAFVFDAAIATGQQVGSVFTASGIEQEATRPYGRALLVTVALDIVVLGATALLRATEGVPTVLARAISLTMYLALAASLSLAGHAISTSSIALRLPLDAIHVIAASVWLGGLVQLLALAPYARENISAIQRFSNVAFPAVVVLLVTGTYATWAELGLHPAELVQSQYGRIIVAKLFLFGATIPLAYMNMKVSVPAIAARPAEATSLLRQYVYRELFLVLVIVGLTAWLIDTSPPS